ncbi:amino acid adenylation domain protein, partial [Yersinia pestis PY-101]
MATDRRPSRYPASTRPVRLFPLWPAGCRGIRAS